MNSKNCVMMFAVLTIIIVTVCGLRFALSPVSGSTKITENIDIDVEDESILDIPIKFKWVINQEDITVTCFEDIETGNEYLVFKELDPKTLKVQHVQVVKRDKD